MKLLPTLNRPFRPQRPGSNRRRRAGERGQILIMMGFMALVLFGIMGLSIDLGRVFVARAQLGRAVDAAALAGVLEFDGTASGTTDADEAATAYLALNEPTATKSITTPNDNTLVVDATKPVKMFFISVLGINTVTVKGHAAAGFSNGTLDAVMVLDVTASMNGSPLTNAKTAAINFKNVLLGATSTGNVVVGMTPFQGCFRPSPMPASKTQCQDATTLQDLTSNSATLSTKINALAAGSGSAGTNVCTGLTSGWRILDDSTYNHNDPITYPNNRRFMVLLSDGDNYYPGEYTYQDPEGTSPPSSPNGETIGGTDYPCQPYDNCSSPWTGSSPCFTGVHTSSSTSGYSVTDSLNTTPPTWNGGTGWSSDWTPSTATTAVVGTITSSPSPQSGSRSLRLGRSGSTIGSIYRTFSLTDVSSPSLTFYARRNSNFTGTDTVLVQISTNGTSWTTIRTFTTGQTVAPTGSWTQYTDSLSAYADQPTVYLRFNTTAMNSTSDTFSIDTVAISGTLTTTTVTPADGYMNGNDNSNPSTCNETPTPRERQLDVRTLNAARAIKAQNVEIFVVAFTAPSISGCNLGSATVYNDVDASECNAVNQSSIGAGPGGSSTNGPVGSTDSDTFANHRLLKCIASSTDETNDHYFFANSAAELPSIFSSIGAQIAQRLVE